MDDPLNRSPEEFEEQPREAARAPEPHAENEPALGPENPPPAISVSYAEADSYLLPEARIFDAEATRKQNLRRNLLQLLGFSLGAFVLTAWILVRVNSPFGAYSTGPRDVVRAQLRALDRGQLRPAYDMFSARYRGQVPFDAWHELIVTHWRMFHAEVLRTGEPAQIGPGVLIEIYLRGADDKAYRARFTVIRSDGHWWIDDVHWVEEPDEQDLSHT